MPAITVAQIAALCGGILDGADNRLISGANTLADAGSGDLSFAENEKAFKAAAQSRAGCLLVPASFHEGGAWSLVRVVNPRASFVHVLSLIYPRQRPTPAVDPTARIDPSAVVGPDSFIGPYVTVGEHSNIGAGCTIYAGCRIAHHVNIGSDTTLHPNVTLYDHVSVGSHVVLHAGCVIGADGFGYTLVGDHYEKFPQVGRVEIEDHVEMGANCCVDRAALGVTRIGFGTKLDNLVHIAHNCTIGKHVVVAAQAGFSGSITVGDYAAIGGQAGIGEKARIDAKAVIGGKSGILTSQRVAAGEPVWGIPARPLRQHLKGLAHVARLQHTLDDIRSLKKRLADLEEKMQEKE